MSRADQPDEERGRLVGELYLMTGDLELAEEVAGRAGNRERAVALLRERRRRRARREGPPAHELPRLSDDQRTVVAALAQLSTVHREAVVLAGVSGLSLPELARALDLPESSARARVSRGRHELEQLLSGSGVEGVLNTDLALAVGGRQHLPGGGDVPAGPDSGAPAPSGKRRNRRPRGAVATVAAVLVAVVAVVGWRVVAGSGSDETHRVADQPSAPSSSASARAARQAARADRIVGSPKSTVSQLAVAPGNGRHALAQWELCYDVRCTSSQFALTVTGDGFQHTHLVGVPPTSSTYGAYLVQPAGPDHFLVLRQGRAPVLADLRGRVHRVTARAGPGPVGSGDVAALTVHRHCVVVDPTRATSHPLAVPRGQHCIDVRGDVLWASDRLGAHRSWSDDGGRTWQHVLTGRDVTRFNVMPILSVASGVQGLLLTNIQTSSNAEWWGALRIAGAGATRLTTSAANRPSVDIGSPVVLSDGRLLVMVTNWSGWSDGGHDPAGLYAGQDWTHLTPLPMGKPFDHLPYTKAPELLAVVPSADGVTLYARSPDRDQVEVSRDLGATWRSIDVR